MATSGGTNCRAGTWLIRARMGWPQGDPMHADRRGARGAAADTGGLMPDLAINERLHASHQRWPQQFINKTKDSDICRLRGVCGHDSGKHHPLCSFSILYFLWIARTRLRSLARNVDSYMRSFCGEGGLMSGQGEPNI